MSTSMTEFANVLPNWGESFSFDAETAPEIISEHFKITEVITWDRPAVHLADKAAVALFLRGRGLSRGGFRAGRSIEHSLDRHQARLPDLGSPAVGLSLLLSAVIGITSSRHRDSRGEHPSST